MTKTPDALSELEHATGLRLWARGTTPVVAATELLIRTGFAQSWRPWVRFDDVEKLPWIVFDEIPDLTGGMSSGEKRLLNIAASLGGSTPIILGDELASLDREWAALVSIAVIHAAGFTEPTRAVSHDGDTPTLITVPALATWPDQAI